MDRTEFDALDEILRGLAAVGELTPRISDMIVSYGERLSSRMIAEAFAARGLDASMSTRGSASSPMRSMARPIPQDALIEQRLKEHRATACLLKAASAVMGGFIGATEKGVTTTLGRGGSDFTAALIGGGIDAAPSKSGQT